MNLKRFICTLPLLGLFTAAGASAAAGQPESGQLPYWQDLRVLSVNRQAPRTAFMTYADRTSAMTMRYEESAFYRSLNGTWKFLYTDDSRTLPADVTSCDTSSWADITVPGNWEKQGFGTAVYVNQPYEFRTHNPQPPQLPEVNPAGVYSRTFSVPAEWAGRDVFLHLAGAKSGVYVYVNGREVGYNEDSKNPAEYLINDYINDGENRLDVKIYRWSTGSYLECQDFWRISGIERDVFLWSQPKSAISDFRIKSMLESDLTHGDFKVTADLVNHRSEDVQLTLRVDMLDAEGREAFPGENRISVTLPAGSGQSVGFGSDNLEVHPWSAEDPY